MKAEIEIPEAFSPVYAEYETLSREDFIDRSRRETIRNHVEKYLIEKGKILELNAGSGIDAVYFAEKGHQVLATDISETSGKYISEKSRQLPNLHFERCSFTSLENLADGKFDHIFSNFGGLNCTDELPLIFSQFSRLLNPGGYVSLVIMPKYYPWEMLSALAGNKNAFRRFKNQATATVGNETISVFYHSPQKIKSDFPENFRHVATQNIGTFYPSAHFISLQKHGKLIKKLVALDNFLNRFWLMPKGIGDYFIITFQKTA